MISKDKFSRILVNLIRAGVFLILFLPLWMNSHFFFPFIVPKNLLFQVAVETIFIAYLILAHLDHKYRPKIDILGNLLLVFLAISTIAGLFGIGIYSSFFGNYERMGGIIHLAHLLLYFFVLTNVFRNKKDWHSFFTFSVFSATIMCFFGLAQWLGVPFLLRSSGGSRLSGTVGNATFLAAYLIFNLFFILYFLAKEKRFDLKNFIFSWLAVDAYLVLSGILYKIFSESDWGFFNVFKVPILNEAIKYPKFFLPFLLLQILVFTVWFLRTRRNSVRILLFVTFLLQFFIFFNTQTRGAMVGLFFSFFILGVVSLFLKINKIYKIIALIIVIIILVSPLLLLAGRGTDFLKKIPTLSRLAEISPKDLTTQSRILTWQASWKGWTESPKSFLIGYGPENYYYAYNKNFPVLIYKDQGSQIWFDRAHNIIFDVGVTTGILGLIVYLGILALAVWKLIRNYNQNKIFSSSWLWVALIIAYFGQNFFVFDTLNTEIPFFLFLGFVSAVGSLGRNSDLSESEVDVENDRKASVNNRINLIYLAILVIILLFGLAFNYRIMRSNQYLFKALIESNGTNIDQVADYFKKSINESVVGKFEARQQFVNYVNGKLIRGKDIPAQKIQEYTSYAIEELEKSVSEEPLNFRHYLYLSTFYNAAATVNRQYPQKVIDLLSEAIQLSPTRPQGYYELGQAYLFSGNTDKAIEYFGKGISLAPWVVNDRLTLINFYVISDRNDLAEAELQKLKDEGIWQPSVADYTKIAELYSRVKNYTKAIEFQQKIIELELTAENYAKLAALYAKIGENQKAIEATQRAVGLNPNFKQEAEKFLELLEAGELLEK